MESGECKNNEDNTCKSRSFYTDALETASRAEGLPFQTSVHSDMRILEEEEEEEEMKRGKYHQSLQLLKPFRTTHKDQHPIDNAGLFSFMTLNWLSPLGWKAYKKSSLEMSDIWGLSCHEASETNCRRFEKLWHTELKMKGKDRASLFHVIWSFCQTRILVAIIALMVTMVTGFIGPAVIIRSLLEYSQSSQTRLPYGLTLVGGIFIAELTRSWSFALMWALNYRTGARLRGAALTFAFDKILKLRSTKDVSIGELVNMCSGDGQRLFEVATVGCLLAGGPLVAVLGLIYTAVFLGTPQLS